ncbi:hypothetical protein AVEN_178217-1 [Araneus ventricosus]|uniref:Uncharacterized protein n=1 Tax=Araneus ventricosus TaxID=182803 RepID=A0A4Y2H3A8_ARAVE|nr:hypothetical protein AVEN_178217-1 [Araneus ventricosus]
MHELIEPIPWSLPEPIRTRRQYPEDKQSSQTAETSRFCSLPPTEPFILYSLKKKSFIRCVNEQDGEKRSPSKCVNAGRLDCNYVVCGVLQQPL